MRRKLLAVFLFVLITTLVFGYENDWTESTPTDSTVANQIDDFMRDLRADTAERLEDYIGGFNASDSNEGFYHILFIENANSLSLPAANKGLLYGKLVGGKCELHWMDEDGDEKQFTSGGVLKIAAGDFDANSIDEDDIELNNDSYLVAANAAGTADVNLIKAGTNNLATLPDGAEMASNAAPTEDEGIANKKYVDDSQDPTYSGGESHTFVGGLIMKMGYEARSGTNTTVEFGTAFPTALISVTVTIKDDTQRDTTTVVNNEGVSSFIIEQSEAATGYYWIAIGH